MAKGRIYAEGLVGPLDRSHYDEQRQVALKSNDTNWQNIQNQYKNLTDQLKKRQEQSNIDYAKGLVRVAEDSLDRMTGANVNMANRGLTSSGLGNLVKQSDTTAKGEEILKLLGNAGDVAVKTAGQLASSNETFTNKAAGLNKDLAGTLGNINAKDTAAQMHYNQGLARLGEAMEAREFGNQMAAAQRALNGSRSGAERSKEDEALEEIYKRRAIAEVLGDNTLSKEKKAATLRVLFDVDRANEAVLGYEDSKNALENYNKNKEELEKAAKRANDRGVGGSQKIVKPDIFDPVSYKNSLFDNNVSPILDNTYTAAQRAGDVMTTNEQHELDEYIKNGLTYRDLAKILYGIQR